MMYNILINLILKTIDFPEHLIFLNLEQRMAV